MNRSISKTIGAVLAVAAITGAAGCSTDTDDDEEDVATSAPEALTGTRRVCTYSGIRRSPNGQLFDFLAPPETFRIVRHCGRHSDGSPCNWYYGYANGHVKHEGWIVASALSGC